MEVWKACELGIDFGIPAAMACAGMWLIWWGFKPKWHWLARRCEKCGYDMRETEGMKCPECGRAAVNERELSGRKRNWKKVAGGVVLILPMFWIAGVLVMTQGPIELYEPIQETDPNAASRDRVFKFAAELSDTSPVRLDLEIVEDAPQVLRPIPPNPIAVWGYTKIRRGWYWLTTERAKEGEPDFFDYDTWGVADPEVLEDGFVKYDHRINKDLAGWDITLKDQIFCCVSTDVGGERYLIYVAHMFLSPVRHFSRFNHTEMEFFEALANGRSGAIKRVVGMSVTSRGGEVIRVPKQVSEALRGVAGVERLEVGYIEMDDSLVDAIVSMPGLKALSFDYVKITGAQLARLGKNPNIKTLVMTGNYKVGEETLKALGQWASLEEVTFSLPLGEWKVEDGDFARFIKAKSLAKVNMSARVRLSATAEMGKVLESKDVVFSHGMVFVFKESEVTPVMRRMIQKGAMNVDMAEE